MAKEPSSAAPVNRTPRADAQRNRDRILQVAQRAFTEYGAEASLDDIARKAGIGPGTLYRHFPTRDALIQGVYHSSVENLTAAGERYLRTLPPLDALRQWMLLFVDYVAEKLLILPALDALPGGSGKLMEGSRSAIYGTFTNLIERAIHSGDLHPGTDPNDIARALIGTFYTTALPGWEASARRIVDMLLEGARRR